MKILGLIRHAKSDWSDGTRDFDRGLNARGRKGARLMGDHIRDHGIKWDALIASPAQRVKTTLEEALPTLRPNGTAASISPEPIRCSMCCISGKAVLVAAHNPGLGDMVLELVAPSHENALFDEAKVKFPTASYAVFELDIDDQADLQPECGKPSAARPRDLDQAWARRLKPAALVKQPSCQRKLLSLTDTVTSCGNQLAGVTILGGRMDTANPRPRPPRRRRLAGCRSDSSSGSGTRNRCSRRDCRASPAIARSARPARRGSPR